MPCLMHGNRNYTGGGGSGSAAISTLTDVDLDNLADGQILKWNATNQKWENANESGGGSSAFSQDVLLLDFTAMQIGYTYLTLADDFDNYYYLNIMKGSASGDVFMVAEQITVPTSKLKDGTINVQLRDLNDTTRFVYLSYNAYRDQLYVNNALQTATYIAIMGVGKK